MIELLKYEAPSLCEVRKAIKNLNNQAAGPDGIKAEIINIYLPELTEAIHKVIYNVWIIEQMPIEMEVGSICPIFKKRDRLECGNY
ncbi:hypothetical protein CDAR_239541 [Caerostris darwini]|uniref:Reverse transcriptase n=1 Tax=Caerostris darwini TaxID=1538125 RepID=A0AAV4SNZ4_9ARAC|nr:hypothetical protein CDAR_239541 [Caerostris darwini]